MMNEQLSILSWIADWFAEECNGDWEHDHQIMIQTTSNPGWLVTIDLSGTNLEDFVKEYVSRVSETDWFFYKFRDGKFMASGDLSKLETLLNAFREVASSAELGE